MKVRRFFDGLQYCIFVFIIFFMGCFALFSVFMIIFLGTIQGFFLFFLGLRVDLLRAVLLHHDPSTAVFWNQELFGVIHEASFGGAILLGSMYLWERSQMPQRHS